MNVFVLGYFSGQLLLKSGTSECRIPRQYHPRAKVKISRAEENANNMHISVGMLKAIALSS